MNLFVPSQMTLQTGAAIPESNPTITVSIIAIWIFGNRVRVINWCCRSGNKQTLEEAYKIEVLKAPWTGNHQL